MIDQNNQYLDHKQALAHLATRLKEVLNPKIKTDLNSLIKISTDINSADPDILIIVVKGLSDADKIIDFTGIIDCTSITSANPNIKYVGNNLGSEFIVGMGIDGSDSKYDIILNSDNRISSIAVEIYLS